MTETKKNRKTTRNTMWSDTMVKMSYRTRYGKGSNSMIKTSASVENLSSKGMFVLTDDVIPVNTELDLQIQFNNTISLNAIGKILRTDKRGIAIVFTEIDTIKLGECIMDRLNVK